MELQVTTFNGKRKSKQRKLRRKSMPAICRGDMKDVDMINCEVPHRLERSPDVFVNSIGISRQGDKNHPHEAIKLFCEIAILIVTSKSIHRKFHLTINVN